MADLEAKKVGTPSEEMLALEAFISSKKDGEFVIYAEVKEQFKIDLWSNSGKGKFYSACKRLGREWVNKPKYGYQLSSAKTALVIADGKVNRIGSAAKRTVRATKNLKESHSDTLTEPQSTTLDNIEYGASAIIGKVRSSKKIIRKEQVRLSEANPVV